jgi:hypothetical protein
VSLVVQELLTLPEEVKANPALRGHLLNKVKANPALRSHLLNKVKPNPTLRGHILTIKAKVQNTIIPSFQEPGFIFVRVVSL